MMDEDYLRELLFEFEAEQDWLILIATYQNMSAESRKRHYHMLLLTDKGFAQQVGNDTYRLTAAGHEFIAAIRDEGIWARTKAVVAEQGGSIPLEILKQLATGLLRKQISDRTGIEL